MKKVVSLIMLFALALFVTGCGAVEKLEAENYEKGVECILVNDFAGAVQNLDGLSTNDSKALFDYASCRTNIDSYVGNAREMLSVINGIDGIENEEVKAQYDTVCEQLELASDIQEEINSIDISSVDSILKANTEEISNKLSDISDEFKAVIDTSNFDIASGLAKSKKDNTALWKLVEGIENIGEVSLDSGESLSSLRSEYDSLGSDESVLVVNYDTLTQAEATYERIREEEEQKEEQLKLTVWVTNTGDAYHIDGCRFLRSKYASMTQLEAIKAGYGPCSECMTRGYVVENWSQYR